MLPHPRGDLDAMGSTPDPGGGVEVDSGLEDQNQVMRVFKSRTCKGKREKQSTVNWGVNPGEGLL